MITTVRNLEISNQLLELNITDDVFKNAEKIFKKDRSSIQRALQTLIEANVIERKSMSLKDFSEKKDMEEKTKRGYLYVYGAKDLEMIKEQTRDLLNRWYASMLNYIENIDSVFDCYEKQGELC